MLGIDPGTSVLGYGLVRCPLGTRSPSRMPTAMVLIECGVVRTRVGDPLPRRLQMVFEGVTDLLRRCQPDAVAVEGVFHGRNARSALLLGHARGVVLLAASQAQLAVAEISPAEVKRAVTGSGVATKPQVAAMVARLLRLASSPRPADAADGVAIALTHLMRLQPGALRASAPR